MTAGALHGVGVSTPSFRALVAQSSNSGLKPFYGHFSGCCDCAQHDGGGRSMTGSERGMTGSERGMTREGRGMTGWVRAA